MAYPRPVYDNRSPIELEHKRSAWDPIPRHQYHNMPPLSSTSTTPSIASAAVLDPESEDSDVSITPGDVIAASALPQSLPAPPSKQALESLDAVQAHLDELSRVEDHNIRKHNRLKEKRARKDEKIQRKRAAQDAKIKAIMDARARRDARIERRRQREDGSFQRVYDDLEEEEMRLRQRLKRLKRGLPLDDQNAAGHSISSSSMSPPGPAYSTIPPPAKRHQTGPPGHNESPLSATSRDQRPYAPAASAPAPSYQFYQGNPAPPPQQQSPYQPPLHPGPMYNNSPQHNTIPASLPPRTAPTPSESITYTVNGQPPSPHVSRPPPLPLAATPNAIPPSRQVSANYDTRPPPPSSGFATINHPTPPQSGFAAINSRATETPPTQQIGLAKDGPPAYTPSRPYATDGTPTSVTGPLLTSSNKRTPSTTHPYQMSEAFANRHHHCEKTDTLNRGIWTWYGPGGTQENPTATPTQMYLQCNHDGCGRIDWRTVHGLQCHIVKNHEQPKGTIGSLEKALERYGVHGKEIEEIEKRDGLGSGGTMADLQKSVKLKAKLEKLEYERKMTPTSAGPTPMGYRANQPMDVNSPSQSSAAPKGFGARGKDDSESDGTPTTEQRMQGRSPSGFAAVNNSWSGINSTPSKPPELNDQVMRDVPAPRAEPIVRQPSTSPKVNTPWPPQHTASDASKPITQDTPAQPPHLSRTNGTQSRSPLNANASPIIPLIPAVATQASSNTHSGIENASLPNNDDKLVKEEVKSTTTVIEVPKDINEMGKTEDKPLNALAGEVNGVDTRDMQDAQNSDKGISMNLTSNHLDGTKVGDEETMGPPLSTSDGSRSAMHSPEIPSKRVSAAGSRRGSRRSSTAAGSRNTVEREREDGIDGIKDKDMSDEDDGQTIIVGGSKFEQRQREKDALDRTRTPPRRLANGRYMRKAK